MSTTRTTDMGDYVLVETGEPTVENPTVWISRDMQWKPGTPGFNQQQTLGKVTAALTANKTFLGLASPTNAQTLAQVQRLTRQMNALFRLLVTEDFTDVSDT